MKQLNLFLQFCLCLLLTVRDILGNPWAKKLHEQLMSDYNKLIRPVLNSSNVLQVKFKLRLSQLIDVHEKNQIMTTNVWLKQEWYDYKLKWNPNEYGGVQKLYVPADSIWLPEIVLYNNADGKYQVSIMTKASLHFNGLVVWEPPAVYKSMCQINVKWFPFDEQDCEMKFGSWTYDGFEVDLVHYDTENVKERFDPEINQTVWEVENGMDLDGFQHSVEWDIMSAPAVRHKLEFPCCPAPYIDISYTINLRRQTLFYNVNLMIPCIGLSFLTILVFYLPSDSGEKVTLSISILISLTVFFLLLVEIIPSTSLVIPLIAKYLLFTMVMVTLSVAVTVVTLNVHYRSPSTHKMPPWIKTVFINYLPRMLMMQRPEMEQTQLSDGNKDDQWSREMLYYLKKSQNETYRRRSFLVALPKPSTPSFYSEPSLWSATSSIKLRAMVNTVIRSAAFIAEHLRKKDSDEVVNEDWKYVAMVLDRLFLWIFSISLFLGIVIIILQAPSFKDKRLPIS